MISLSTSSQPQRRSFPLLKHTDNDGRECNTIDQAPTAFSVYDYSYSTGQSCQHKHKHKHSPANRSKSSFDGRQQICAAS